jgi:hypothetical protein
MRLNQLPAASLLLEIEDSTDVPAVAHRCDIGERPGGAQVRGLVSIDEIEHRVIFGMPIFSH